MENILFRKWLIYCFTQSWVTANQHLSLPWENYPLYKSSTPDSVKDFSQDLHSVLFSDFQDLN